MNRTRWKLLIGTLGLSLGGLAAVADVPSRNGIVSCAPGKPHQVARVAHEAPPNPVPALKVADVPVAPTIPAPAIIPAIPDLTPPSHLVQVPAPAPVTPVPAPPLPTITLSEPVKPQPKAQMIEVTVPAATIEPLKVPTPVPLFESPPLPTPVVSSFVVAASPSAPQPTAPTAIPAQKPSPSPAPALTFTYSYPDVPKPAGPAPVVAQNIPQIPAVAPSPKPLPPTPAPSWEPRAQAIPTEALSEPTRNLEKKLKVMLHMGDERPRFEVKEGDEIYLKVTSDKVEVKSPSDSGANMSTMRAGGKVTFITPGGEGTCDELSVVPGTGQVVVSGKVTFTYNWGKVETTVSGEKMTFRLGSTPGTTPSGGTQGVPTSYQRMR